MFEIDDVTFDQIVSVINLTMMMACIITAVIEIYKKSNMNVTYIVSMTTLVVVATLAAIAFNRYFL